MVVIILVQVPNQDSDGEIYYDNSPNSPFYSNNSGYTYMDILSNTYGIAPWFRFVLPTIPQGTIITSAQILLRVSFGGVGSSTWRWSFEDTDSALPYTGVDNTAKRIDYMTRSRTSAYTDRICPSASGVYTVDMTSSLQEVLDRGGWTPGNYVCIQARPVIRTNSSAGFTKYGAVGMPQLVVTYSSSSSSSTSSSSSSNSSSSSSSSLSSSSSSTSSSSSSSSNSLSSSSSTSMTVLSLKHFWYTLRNAAGEPREGELVYAYEAESTTLLNLYDFRSRPIANPMTTSTGTSGVSAGIFDFFLRDEMWPSGGYEWDQRIKLQWDHDGVNKSVDKIMTWGEYHPIYDEAFDPLDFSSITPPSSADDDYNDKNKAISNTLACKIQSHIRSMLGESI